MRKSLVFLVLATLALSAVPVLFAEEGMWMMHQLGQLNQQELKKLGLQLTPEQLWDPKTGVGLASATPSLGGCSASFVSNEGLIVTNHHCAFGAIQLNSSPEHDYITNGFLARTKAEELQARGSRVLVFKGYDEITDKLKSVLKPGMKPEERTKAFDIKEKELIAECEKAGLRCSVAAMYGGMNYYMFKQMEIRDVRLVYAAPRAIGEFGGETDNWMWPRHTGDFSFLRAYVGSDGKPAEYSLNNVPFKPDRFLKVATTPIHEGEFAMIMGYPGRTVRYRLSGAIADDAEYNFPNRIKILKDWIAILDERGKTSKDVEIKLASTKKGLLNSFKNSEGQLEGLLKANLAASKKAEEEKLTAWINADSARKAKFGDAIAKLEALQAERRATREHDLYFGYIGRSSSLLSAAITINRNTQEKKKPDIEREFGFQARDERAMRMRMNVMQRNLDLDTDRVIMFYFFDKLNALPANQHSPAVDGALASTGKTGKEAIEALIDKLLSTSLADDKVRLAALDLDETALAAKKDPMLDFAAALLKEMKADEEKAKRYEGENLVLMPQYMEALTTFRKAATYPDANGTLRFTYATVKGYQPRDGVYYKPFTTLTGVVEKHKDMDPEFDCPDKLLEAAKQAKTTRWVDPKLGDVPACFLSTNDITGGNSGSPIMNGKGELVGLAFDGNYEWRVTDYVFSPTLSRTINVSATYMLWVMDYVDKAHNLMREMGIEPESK